MIYIPYIIWWWKIAWKLSLRKFASEVTLSLLKKNNMQLCRINRFCCQSSWWFHHFLRALSIFCLMYCSLWTQVIHDILTQMIMSQDYPTILCKKEEHQVRLSQTELNPGSKSFQYSDFMWLFSIWSCFICEESGKSLRLNFVSDIIPISTTSTSEPQHHLHVWTHLLTDTI